MDWPKDKFTRFEVARLIGARALQISLGAPVLTKSSVTKPSEIAKAEFKERIIPITIKRKMPNNESVIVEVKKAMEKWIIDHKGEI